MLIAAAVLFLMACATPALDLRGTDAPESQNIWWGWQALILGWLGMLGGDFAWLANVFFLSALICLGFGRWRTAMVFAVVALVFAADTLRLTAAGVPSDEGGTGKLVLHQVLIGCYLWAGSMVVTAGGAVFGWWSSRRPVEQAVG